MKQAMGVVKQSVSKEKTRVEKSIRSLFRDRRVRYFLSGSLIFAINMGLAYIIFQFQWTKDKMLSDNVSNLITTELMVLISFLIHRRVTWRKISIDGLFHQLWRFHIVSAVGLTVRTGVFVVTLWMGMHALIATVLSIVAIVAINYFGFDRYAFGNSDPL